MRNRKQHYLLTLHTPDTRETKHHEPYRTKPRRYNAETHQGLGRSSQISRLLTCLETRIQLLKIRKRSWLSSAGHRSFSLEDDTRRYIRLSTRKTYAIDVNWFNTCRDCNHKIASLHDSLVNIEVIDNNRWSCNNYYEICGDYEFALVREFLKIIYWSNYLLSQLTIEYVVISIYFYM